MSLVLLNCTGYQFSLISFNLVNGIHLYCVIQMRRIALGFPYVSVFLSDQSHALLYFFVASQIESPI